MCDGKMVDDNGMAMKHKLWVLFMIGAVALPALAQESIYRCGNEYTNTKPTGARDCKLIVGGQVTVVPGTRVAKAGAPAGAASNPARSDSADQKAREADARLILQSELRKAQARHEDLLKEYNNGEPERLGPETRNNQKYLDRVAELKAAIGRNEADIAGIKRELSRVPAQPTSASSTASSGR